MLNIGIIGAGDGGASILKIFLDEGVFRFKFTKLGA